MKTATKVFVASVLCLATAYALILNNGIVHVNLYFALSIILGTVGTLLFFWSLSGILIKIMQRNKRLYFKQLNMFVVRQFPARLIRILYRFLLSALSCCSSSESFLPGTVCRTFYQRSCVQKYRMSIVL